MCVAHPDTGQACPVPRRAEKRVSKTEGPWNGELGGVGLLQDARLRGPLDAQSAQGSGGSRADGMGFMGERTGETDCLPWASKKCAKKARKNKCRKRKVQRNCPATCGLC